MSMTKSDQAIDKGSSIEKLHAREKGPLGKYQDFFIGTTRLRDIFWYEFNVMLFSWLPGAIGLLLRKFSYPHLLKRVGSGVVWGRNIVLRHPGKISIGDRSAIDDNCIIDARGAGEDGIRIGNDVLIARDTLIQAKTADIAIGDRCVIGSQCQLSSAGGIQIGECVMLAGQCYLGGGRYRTESRETPMMDQGLYTKGPVIIEGDVWLGADVTVVDGVRIGKGAFIGAGAIVTEDVEEYQIVVPYQKHIHIPRGQSPVLDKRESTEPTKRIEEAEDEVSPDGSVYERVLKSIFGALGEVNQQLPQEQRLVLSEDTVLIAGTENRNIDSLGLVNLIVATEQKVEEELGASINLTNGKLIGNNYNYIETVGSLAEYISHLLKNKR